LVRDFGQAVQSGAWMTALRRTKIGEYSIEAAWQLDDLLARIAKL
jgi:tRNA pseudouridine55 synthase